METMNVNYPGYTDGAKGPLIVLPTSKGIILIPVQEIIRIQSISNYSKLFFSNGKSLVVAKVLRWFEEQTGLFSFIRIHRTHFVNIKYIKNYSGGKSGLLFLRNGEIFSVARRKKADLSKRLNSLTNSFADESACTSQLNTKKILAA
jgi:two-component system, LytTR family, response regulator